MTTMTTRTRCSEVSSDSASAVRTFAAYTMDEVKPTSDIASSRRRMEDPMPENDNALGSPMARVLHSVRETLVLSTAAGVLARNPSAEALASGGTTYATSTTPDTARNVLDLNVIWRGRNPAIPAPWETTERTTKSIAAGVDKLLSQARGQNADARSAQAALTVAEEDVLWRGRRSKGWLVNRNSALEARQELRGLLEGATQEIGLDLSRHNNATVRWLRERGAASDLKLDWSGAPKVAVDIDRSTEDPQLQRYLQIREWGSELTAVNTIAKSMAGGRVFATLDINRAVTGRALMSRPNLNALKKSRGELLIAEPGNVLISTDMKNAELRVLAALLPLYARPHGDSDYLASAEAFAQAVMETDPYVHIADHAGSDVDRKVAKMAFLARTYGQGAPALGGQIGSARASRIGQAIRTLYPVLPKFFDRVMARARSGAPLTTLWGRRLPAPDDGKYYKAVNYVVQGSARDAFGVAMRNTSQALGSESLWLPAHDEIIVEVPAASGADALGAMHLAFDIDLGRGVRVLGEPELLGRSWSKQ